MQTQPDPVRRKIDPIGVLLVDDLASVRQGLRMRLSIEPDLRIVGEASDGTSALIAAERLCPDVIVMDLEMPGMDGISATQQLAGRSQAGIVILSIYDESNLRARALENGAFAFLSKGEGMEPLLLAIRSAAGVRRNRCS